MPGQVERFDYEYKRNGTRNLFMLCEPQGGWRHIEVTEHRRKNDFANQMKWLVDERYPEAEVIRVVMDNLNTHTKASLYETFEPAGGKTYCEEVGISSHAQAWKLAQSGRNRVEYIDEAMFGS